MPTMMSPTRIPALSAGLPSSTDETRRPAFFRRTEVFAQLVGQVDEADAEIGALAAEEVAVEQDVGTILGMWR